MTRNLWHFLLMSKIVDNLKYELCLMCILLKGVYDDQSTDIMAHIIDYYLINMIKYDLIHVWWWFVWYSFRPYSSQKSLRQIRSCIVWLIQKLLCMHSYILIVHGSPYKYVFVFRLKILFMTHLCSKLRLWEGSYFTQRRFVHFLLILQ